MFAIRRQVCIRESSASLKRGAIGSEHRDSAGFNGKYRRASLREPPCLPRI